MRALTPLLRVCLCLCLCPWLTTLALGGELEYRLEPGTELVYEGSAGTGAAKTRLGCRVWVARENRDGTHRIYVVMTTSGMGRPQTSWSWADMAPDGTYEPNATTSNGAPPEHVLPPLPRAAQPERKIGFKTFTYEEKAPGVFACRETSVEDRVFGSSRSSTLILEEGLPVSIAIEVGAVRPDARKSEGSLRLKERHRIGAESFERLVAELEAFFAAMQVYEQTRDETVLKHALESATIESIQVRLRQALRDHPELAKYEKERAEAHGKRIGKPSPEWETEDFSGNRHSIAGYRGKVVLLDFWFRRCGWCIRAMPQIKQVAAHYEGKPVAVLGMNVDRNASDATFVIGKMELEYPNLKARDIAKEYAVMGYPTLIVIDKKGVVRRYQTGHSPDLRAELIALVDELLAEPG